MTPFRTTAATLAIALCGACATTAPLEPASSRALSGATLAGRLGETPDFVAHTFGKAGFGLIGLALMKSKGRAVVAENDIEDPAVRVAEALIDDLAARFGARPVELGATADFAIDVSTIGWNYIYYLGDAPLPYRVMYGARATLVDVDSGAVLAEGSCDARPGDKATAPTLDEMLADGATRLKSELRDAAELCVEELRRSVFGLGDEAA